MKLDLIQCNVAINHGEGNTGMTEVVKAGPAAITTAEALLLMMKHSVGEGPEAYPIKRVIKVGEVEVDQFQLLNQLSQIYGGPLVKQAYPTARHIPKTVADLDLPAENMGPPRNEPVEIEPEPEEVAEEKSLEKALKAKVSKEDA